MGGSEVRGDVECEFEYSSALACTSTEGGMGFGDDVDGDYCVWRVKAR